MSSTDEVTKKQKFIRLVMIFIGIVLLITIVLAILFYPETYEFFKEAISNLGATQSENGLDNHYSMIVMVIGFWIIAGCSFTVFLIYVFSRKIKKNIIKALLTLAITIGAIGVSIPLDLFSNIHYFGASLFVFSFCIYNFNCQVLRYSRKHRPNPDRKTFNYWIDLIVAWLVLLSIIFYFVVFLLVHIGVSMPYDWLNVALTQKIVLIFALFAVLLLDPEDT
ncbi:MAG: DUF998 domain-containing protein [Candidatus Heimdallarchaeaceae archaeon]